ncbi:Hydrogenase-4 component B [Rickettsiales bacterium Ac37b]|nr:Hydrogenase-4 component B [Rickettsiales bacterium Ac37b]
MNILINPAYILLLSGIVLCFIPARFFKLCALIQGVCTIVATFIFISKFNHPIILNFIEFELLLSYITPLAPLFIIAFSLVFLLNLLFSFGDKQYNKTEIIAAFIYAGSAISIITSGDLISMFFSIELMSISATIIIFSAQNLHSYLVSKRYFIIHITAGIIFLIGTIIYIKQNGNANIIPFQPIESFNSNNLASIFILGSILINVGSIPFSSWIADSYPEASYSGSCFLSVFTTKTSVFLLLTYFPGNTILIYLGLAMIFYGIIYAILENNIRRILSYSLVNQVGFMVLAAGIGSNLAIKGAALHAFCHIFYKTLLFMSAGAVIFSTHKHKCTELGGLFTSMRYTAICAIIGAAAISGFPLTSGFISKAVIVEAAHNYNLFIWWGLIIASAGVFLHAGLEFPWFTFFQRKPSRTVPEVPLLMKIAMGCAAFICIYLGVDYKIIYNLLPNQVYYEPYSFSHIYKHSELLLSSAAAFFLLLPMLKRQNTISLDIDFFYRKLPKDLTNILHQCTKLFANYRTNFSQRMEKSNNILVSIVKYEHILSLTIYTTIIILLCLITFSII